MSRTGTGSPETTSFLSFSDLLQHNLISHLVSRRKVIPLTLQFFVLFYTESLSPSKFSAGSQLLSGLGLGRTSGFGGVSVSSVGIRSSTNLGGSSSFGVSSNFGTSPKSFSPSSNLNPKSGNPDIFSAMISYYEVVDKSKANPETVNKALQRYSGNEDTMVAKLEQKYKHPFPSYQKESQAFSINQFPSSFSSSVSTSSIAEGMKASHTSTSITILQSALCEPSSTGIFSPATPNVSPFSTKESLESTEESNNSLFGNGFGQVIDREYLILHVCFVYDLL